MQQDRSISMRAAFLFVVSMCILPAWALAEGTWFGKVIDQTTGAGPEVAASAPASLVVSTSPA